MPESSVLRERAVNLWSSFERKFPPVAKSTRMDPDPAMHVDQIGGLATAKEEVLTYACAATDPEVYARWGTRPPSALLLIGRPGVGKTLLARALATRSATAFVHVSVPRLVVEVVHRGGQVGELLDQWGQTMTELPPVTCFFDELEFSQAEEIGSQRPDLPVGPIMDFLLDLIERTIATKVLVVGASSHPDSLRPAFLQPGRFERVVEVSPKVPDDVVAALVLQKEGVEKRAGRPLFGDVDWERVVESYAGLSTGDWVRVLHAVLRGKARCEAAAESTTPVSTEDLLRELDRVRQTRGRLPAQGGGIYL